MTSWAIPIAVPEKSHGSFSPGSRTTTKRPQKRLFESHDDPITDPADGESNPPLDALIISDLHLGSENCQAKPLAALLEQILAAQIQTRRLIINGDVFDSIDFRRLKKTHWKVLSLIRHLSDKIDIIWIAGNHDGSADIISQLLGVSVQNEYILTSARKKMLIIHGHRFDDFIDHHPILTWLADFAYALLQTIDRTHYVARLAKKKSKIFVHCLEKIERGAIHLARQKNCSAALCGHTHHAVAKIDQPIPYFNSGCWTEKSATTYLAVKEGKVELLYFHAPDMDADAPAQDPDSVEAAAAGCN